MNTIKRHRRSLLLLAVYFLVSLLYQWTNQPIGVVRTLWTPLDERIPFWSAFILVYHSWYPFILVGLWQVFVRDEGRFHRLMRHLIIAQLIAIVIFVVFQTEVIRPEITSQDIFSRLVEWTYRIDRPYNGFPSIHVLTSLITAWHYGRVFRDRPVQVLSYRLYSGLIILSTLFVKQHMVWDILGALAVAGLSYAFGRSQGKEVSWDETKQSKPMP